MEPSGTSAKVRNRTSGSEFFLQSPFRHPYFLAGTFALSCITIIGVFILVRAEIPLILGLSVVGSLCFLFPAWFFALRTHKEIQSLLTGPKIDKVEVGSPLDIALSAASWMINVGLCLSFAGALVFLSVLTEVIRFH